MENKREYLIFEDIQRDSSLNSLFDSCIAAINDGTARISKTYAKAGYPSYACFRAAGKEILVEAPLEYYLYKLGDGFAYESAKNFTDAMRKLCGWKWDVDRVLRSWIKRVIQEPFFEEIKDEDGYSRWTLKPGEPSYELPYDFIRFACYIAVCHVKYGASYDSYTTNEIFGYLASLGSDLPAKLKEYGSGELPKELAEYKDNTISCKANDVFAAIKITLKDDSEEGYRKTFDFLCRLLKFGFPKSYSIDFRNPGKNWLSIKGLPKKGEHQSIQGQFVLAYIEKYGFTKHGSELYDLCEDNIQHLPKKLVDLRKKLI